MYRHVNLFEMNENFHQTAFEKLDLWISQGIITVNVFTLERNWLSHATHQLEVCNTLLDEENNLILKF